MRQAGEPLTEFEIIERYLAPLATDPAALGLRDDAAVLTLAGPTDLVITTDAIVSGVHFLPDDPPGSVGHKALAVNLSDLAAKAAVPWAYLLTLALPGAPAAEWCKAFTAGLAALQEAAGIALIGGDIVRTSGPLMVSVTAIGRAPEGGAVLRAGAKPGDRIYVTGMIGDAYLGLRLLRNPDLASAWGLSAAEGDSLIERYRRPSPRLAASNALQLAHAAMDISDGLAGDLAKLCRASGTGAEIASDRVPLSPAGRKAAAAWEGGLDALISGGDDYEILAAVPVENAAEFELRLADAKLRCSEIGEMHDAAGGILLRNLDGTRRPVAEMSFDHFRALKN